jgi:hypothetical protein
MCHFEDSSPMPDSQTLVFPGIAQGIHKQREVLLRQIQNFRQTRDVLLPRLLSGQVQLKTGDA